MDLLFHLLLFLQEETGGSGNALVEITCLEEEETHEEESPTHEVVPRDTHHMLPTQAAHGNGVITHHADDAKAAQKVKSMVTLFHVSYLLEVIGLRPRS